MGMTPQEFINRWVGSAAAELANSQSFLKELCTLLDVENPEPTKQDESQNTYVFEKAVEFNNGDGTTSAGRVDLYRKDCFVLESKQGGERKAAEQEQVLAEVTKRKKQRTGTAQRGTTGWEKAMVKARQQAKRYAEALPDEWPPFLIVVDVGHCFDVYADFSQSGKNYVPFPDPVSYRIPLAKLDDADIRARLRTLWTDPHSLDPAKQTAKVTRELAAKLAELAKRLEARTDDDGEKLYTPEHVSQFIMRCLFTMFAEDVHLGGFSEADFTNFLKSRRGKLDTFVPMLESLWQTMDTGGFSTVLEGTLKRFNGGLFEDHTALPVTEDQLELLIEAATARWEAVEPAIFGTLLERALDPVERHKLGAHYTPRAYVERLVQPTIIEPLRDEWEAVYATAVQLDDDGKTSDAQTVIREYHEKLCETRVLDPACGSGNFLYVSLELMKRLEGEVLNALQDFGEKQLPLLTIDPHQFLGIEINPRAAAIADLVLWIGYLQWHFRTRGNQPIVEPIIKNYDNIECRDAVLAWDSVEPVVDEDGHPVTRWDGRTTKPHPVTGEEVPDEAVRVQEMKYLNPLKAEWKDAEFIVGNPPFIGQQRMRFYLGDGYVDALRSSWSSMPETCDYVMYWWSYAAELVRSGESVRQFGLVTTNSISQSLNRQVVEEALEKSPPIKLAFAVPDHPWEEDGNSDSLSKTADVRVAMTVATSSDALGVLAVHDSDRRSSRAGLREEGRFAVGSGWIHPDLTLGVDLNSCETLVANKGIAIKGLELGSQGFLIENELAEDWLISDPNCRSVLKPYMNGDDLKEGVSWRHVIDFHGLSFEEAQSYPRLIQHVIDNVQASRSQNRESRTARQWWLFRRSGAKLRAAVQRLDRFIGTTRTARHRVFQFCPTGLCAESKIVVVASDDSYVLGVLSSWPHVLFATRIGGWLGIGNDPTYNHLDCFERFPFPELETVQSDRISELAARLDQHRKDRQQEYPGLTMTGMYNVLEKLRAGEALSAKEQGIHEQGLVSVLKQIHDDLDAAVCEAYGWPLDMADEEILERLVALNHERAAEEAQGLVRWLRPDFQNPDGQTQTQIDVPTDKPAATKPAAPVKKQQWPTKLPEQMQLLKTTLDQQPAPLTAAELSKLFKGGRGRAATIEELLETLAAIGQARQTDDGRYAA